MPGPCFGLMPLATAENGRSRGSIQLTPNPAASTIAIVFDEPSVISSNARALVGLPDRFRPDDGHIVGERPWVGPIDGQRKTEGISLASSELFGPSQGSFKSYRL